ncbi:MAG TPA: diguanylate cyclase [Miltoncostaeaceae bacterium]|nr:diguanylate cyclase [Miltoncostaeaceae bacterium]
MLAAAPDAVWIVEIEGGELRVADLSDRAALLAGVPREELVGAPAAEAIPALGAAEALVALPEGAEPIRMDVPLPGPHGGRLMERLIVRADGRRLLISDREVTARWHAYMALADTCPDVIARFDRRLAHAYVNLAGVEVVGLPREDILGRTNRELGMAPAFCDLWEGMLTEVFRSGAPRRFEFAYPDPRGPRWYESRIVPEHDPNGVVTHIVAVSRDQTDRRDLELRLARETEENAHRAAREGALRRMAESVARGDAAWRVFHLAAQEGAALLAGDAAWVIALHPDGAREAGAWSAPGVSPGGVPVEVLLEADGALGRAMRTGRAARVDDHRRLDDEGARAIAAQGFRGAVAAPVIVNGSVWGFLLVAWTRPDPDAQAEEVLSLFAELVGLSLANHATAAELDRLARTDPLTGLANRRAFFDRLAGEVSLARRHDHPVALAVIDIDFFKRVNDVHGHVAGDRTLIEVSRRLGGAVRRGEVLARVGGEEFAWLLPRSGLASASAAVERGRERVSGRPIPAVGRLTLSAGVTVLADGETPEDLFRRADDALYRAKHGGRDRIEVG